MHSCGVTKRYTSRVHMNTSLDTPVQISPYELPSGPPVPEHVLTHTIQRLKNNPMCRAIFSVDANTVTSWLCHQLYISPCTHFRSVMKLRMLWIELCAR